MPPKVKGAPLSCDFKKDTLTREQEKRLLAETCSESVQEKQEMAHRADISTTMVYSQHVGRARSSAEAKAPVF